MTDVNRRALAWLATALEMEEKGKRFYEQAAQNTQNPLGREIWSLLAGYEVIHMDKIREISAGLTGGRSWTEDLTKLPAPEDLGVVFRRLTQKHQEHIRPDTSDLEALNVGIDFESTSLKFYEDHRSQAVEALEKRFLELMAAEERGHLNMLTDLKYYYTDPEGWLLEKDRAGLDGV